MSEKPEVRFAKAAWNLADECAKLEAENERLREALNRFEYSSDGHIKRYPEEEEVIAALRRDDT